MKGGGNGRSPRKLAYQRHRPARFPHAKIWDRAQFAQVGGKQANRSTTVVPAAGMQGVGGKREIPEKTRRRASSSGAIPTCENPGATPPGDRTRSADVGG
ncbi:hypothetical protein PR048_023210 [Dryococelus australis]|uniref:Uncharacterized protein n=1 Tax=Dryococelus australis TaxID=614101 RepID=A0ABQ9GTF9_9NEOP|nr:hypothetical protein PR048_023210 [Dryococelus australis]